MFEEVFECGGVNVVGERIVRVRRIRIRRRRARVRFFCEDGRWDV